MKSLKPVKKISKPAEATAKASKAPEELVETLQEKLAQLEADLANTEARLHAALNKTDEMTDEIVEKKVNSVLTRGSLYLAAIEQRIVQRFFDFLNNAPIWELLLMPSTSVGSGMDHDQMRKLYAQGWRYLGSSRDNKTGAFKGTLLHKPKLPTTYEEFKKVYKDYHNGSLTGKLSVQVHEPEASEKKKKKLKVKA